MNNELMLAAERLRRARHLRNRLFGNLAVGFGEPAWDLLLTLFAAGDTNLPLESAGQAASCSERTAKRWLRWLEERGLVIATTDEFKLSARGAGLMTAFLVRQAAEEDR